MTRVLNKTRLTFCLLFGVLLVAQPLLDPDYFWHLKAGEYINAHGALPAGDVFSSTRFGKAWVLHEWLFEVVLAWVASWWGPWGVRALTTGFVVAALGLLHVTTRRISGSSVVAGVVCLAAVIPVVIGAAPRPQLVTYLLLMVFTGLLLEFKYRRAKAPAIAMALLMVVWANAHGGFMAGVALVVLFALGEWTEYWLAARRTEVQRGRLVRLSQATIVVVLATLATPWFLAHLLYPLEVMGMSANEMLQEWRSPDFHSGGPFAFLLFVIAFVTASVFSSRKPGVTEVLVPGFFILNGFISIRHIPLAALVAGPFFGLALSRIDWAPMKARWRDSAAGRWYERYASTGEISGKKETILNWSLLYAGAFVIVVAIPIFRKNETIARERIYPVAATDYVVSHGISGRMFNDYTYGGYLIYRLSPRWKVFIDGRADLYGDEFVADFRQIYEGKAQWKDKFDRLGIDFAILDRDAPLRQLLLASPDFREVYADRHHSVLVRGTEFRSLVAQREPASSIAGPK